MDGITDPSPCRGCGAAIRFVKTFAGRSSPVDAKPIKVFVATNTFYSVVEGYVSHFSTCSEADKFRYKKSGAIAQEGKKENGTENNGAN